MKAIRNGYELWLASYLVRSLVMLLFRQEIWYLHADGRRRFGFRGFTIESGGLLRISVRVVV